MLNVWGAGFTRVEVASGSTISELIGQLDLTEWISFGLSVAVNGERCSVDTVIDGPSEIALLPPVSGG
ncbi:MAG: MoaD/ThiS family protein [Poseidonia sp.]